LEGGVAQARGRRAPRPGARPRPAVRRKDRVRVKRASWRAARQVRGTRWPLTPGVVARRIAAAAPDVGIAAAFIWVAADPALWDATEGTTLWRAALMEFWA